MISLCGRPCPSQDACARWAARAAWAARFSASAWAFACRSAASSRAFCCAAACCWGSGTGAGCGLRVGAADFGVAGSAADRPSAADEDALGSGFFSAAAVSAGLAASASAAAARPVGIATAVVRASTAATSAVLIQLDKALRMDCTLRRARRAPRCTVRGLGTGTVLQSLFEARPVNVQIAAPLVSGCPGVRRHPSPRPLWWWLSSLLRALRTSFDEIVARHSIELLLIRPIT